MDAQYAPPPAKPRRPAVDATFTMCPRRRAFIPGRTARDMRNGPRRFTAITRSKTSRVHLLDGRRDEDPRVVDEDVDGPELLLGGGDDARDDALVRDVARQDGRRGAELLELFLDFGEVLLRAADERDLRALEGEGEGDARPIPRPAPVTRTTFPFGSIRFSRSGILGPTE